MNSVKKILIGDTGLIGTGLKETISFDFSFNSKNINSFSNFNFDYHDLYLSCLPATKWIINQNLENDIKNIKQILNIISKYKYRNIILISTIDVYCESEKHANENDTPKIKTFNYGSNRYLFEVLVTQFIKYENIKIFRLPALFNKKIKKNILFDLMNNNQIDKININSKFQWYNLDNLAEDIEKYSFNHNEEKIFNLFTEPLETKYIIELFPKHTDKIKNFGKRIEYDFTTKYNKNKYIKTKEIVLSEIEKFINETRSQPSSLGH